jgi:hypothetical protein
VADVAIIVMALVPSWPLGCAMSRIELLPATGFVIVGGVKIAVTPVGNPVTVKLSDPENPPVTEVVIGTRALLLCASDTAVEVVATWNPLTTSVTTTVGAGDTPPPVPVTVIE